MEKLEKIYKKYSKISHNEDNYYVGGGIDNCKFASNRHEDACRDEGKLTLGKACQMFKMATGCDIDTVREVIQYAVPNMEWHHAGKLPKSYGGGMKKTYFINSKEICNIALNWNDLMEKLNISKATAKRAEEEKKNLEKRKYAYLEANAKKVFRIPNKPMFFYETAREMNGKYGWFDSTHKDYNLTEYYSGWEFDSEEKYHEFHTIK